MLLLSPTRLTPNPDLTPNQEPNGSCKANSLLLEILNAGAIVPIAELDYCWELSQEHFEPGT